MTDLLAQLADLAGILPSYRDGTRTEHQTNADTRRALLAAMGYDVSSRGAVNDEFSRARNTASERLVDAWLIAEPGQAFELPDAARKTNWVLTQEDGKQFEGRGPLPAMPLGLHQLEVKAQPTTIICAPPALPLPGLGWGVTLPLYGLRAASEGGLGDFGDLARAAAGFGALGAAFVGINPIHMGFPLDEDAFSPYTPSHRRRLNPFHISDPSDTAGQGNPLVDYPGSIAHRTRKLSAEFSDGRSADDPDFREFRAREGAGLHLFALHQALSETHGPYWNAWPASLRAPDTADVLAFARANSARLDFHAWLQWRAHCALRDTAGAARRAGLRHGLYLDLAVGTHPFGAETWSEPEQFARDVSLGAPPDAFSPNGQTWHLAPFSPKGLVERGFATLAETLRAQLQYAGLLRIDHILGFARAFWVPFEPEIPGAYVRMPEAAMLAVARLEAARAGAVVVGEDLGNVPPGLRKALRRSGLLGCSVVQFEQSDLVFKDAADYEPVALASFGTHDLPTWEGWCAGADITVRAELDLIDAPVADAARDDRAKQVAALDKTLAGRSVETFLAAVPSRLVALQVEDLLGVREQPNLPGTVDEYPNWRRRLPVDAAALADQAASRDAAGIMKKHGR